uniref:Uncharacterized protein n=1 Tax=Marseillevirus LCMAC201 TaxID=2506605 RepID=A0A481YV80_9VIRU|nr:MAG: hypothetical protein LCMAC201_00950 [Marseillevirus LCMAC201]
MTPNHEDITFNGGKLYHIYSTTVGKRKGGLVYNAEYTSSDSQQALVLGKKQLKVDGECSALHSEGDKWVFYRRQDNYKGPEPIVPLALGKQLPQYNQGGKEHNYSWLYADPEWTTGKGKRRSYPGPDTYSAITKAVEAGLLPKADDPGAPEWITCEWVGTKHQQNMDGIPYEHALIPHLHPFVPELELTTLQEFIKLASTDCFEGLVVLHPNGTRYKMRSDMTGDSQWEQHRSKKPAEPGVTTIRPQVLTKEGLLVWNRQEWVLQK